MARRAAARYFALAMRYEREHCPLFSYLIKLGMRQEDRRLRHPEMNWPTATNLKVCQQPCVTLGCKPLIEGTAHFLNQVIS